MLNDKDKEQLIHRYGLATSPQYKEIRQNMLDFIVKCGNSTILPERIQGMLILINYVDGWVKDYEKELENRKEN